MAKSSRRKRAQSGEQVQMFGNDKALVAYNFQIQKGRLDSLRVLAENDAVSVSHLIRQAVNELLQQRGVL